MKPCSENRSIADDIRNKIENKSLQNIELHYYSVTDSTNTRAKERAKEKCDTAPAVFISAEQTAGRGRMGRRFESPRDGGLYISFLFYPHSSMTDAGFITASAAVRAARVIEELCAVDVRIKWVNDLYVGEKKLAGILTEGEASGDGEHFAYAICGIGINLKGGALSEEIAEIATSIEECGGKLPDLTELAARLTEEFFAPIDRSAVMEEYRNRSSIIGKDITVHPILDEPYAARAVDITDEGALVILRDGSLTELQSAEVSIRKI